MLKLLRNKKTAKRIWIALAIVIMPAFLFWGLGSAVRSKEETAFIGKINGKKIPLLEYKEALSAVRNAAIIRFGDKFEEVQKDINLEAEAWERLLLLYEAKKYKLTASDQEVIESIESYAFFQRKGNFDNRIYNDLLKYAFRTSARAFEEQMRENLIIVKLYRKLTDNITLDDKEVREEYIKAATKEKGKLPIDEKKFSLEKNDFAKRLLEQKKLIFFANFIEELKKKSQ